MPEFQPLAPVQVSIEPIGIQPHGFLLEFEHNRLCVISANFGDLLAAGFAPSMQPPQLFRSSPASQPPAPKIRTATKKSRQVKPAKVKPQHAPPEPVRPEPALANPLADQQTDHSTANSPDALAAWLHCTPADILPPAWCEVLTNSCRHLFELTWQQRSWIVQRSSPSPDRLRLEIEPAPPTNSLTDASVIASPDSLTLADSRVEQLEPTIETPIDATAHLWLQQVQHILNHLQTATTIEVMLDQLVHHLQDILGFERVLAYRFSDNGYGCVMTEARSPSQMSFLGLHFPHTDTVACRMQFLSGIPRIIYDTQAELVPLIYIAKTNPATDTPATDTSATAKNSAKNPATNPTTDKPDTDKPDASTTSYFSYTGLRGIAPCHQVYLETMQARSTLVIPILFGDRIWGLLSCYHGSPKTLTYLERQACQLIGQSVSLEITSKEEARERSRYIQVDQALQLLLNELVRSKQVFQTLSDHLDVLLALTDASGVALCFGSEFASAGTIPDLETLQALVDWVQEQPNLSFHTHNLASLYPPARLDQAIASGLLVQCISPDLSHYIFWFRPESQQPLYIHNNPQLSRWVSPQDQSQSSHHSNAPSNTQLNAQSNAPSTSQISPQSSARKQPLLGSLPTTCCWQDQICGFALPWSEAELHASQILRNTIVNLFLNEAEELQRLNHELERANSELEKFAHIASHDLQEPLNLITSYVQLLEVRYRDRLDADAHDFISFAVEGVELMQALIDDLLMYSRVGSAKRDFEMTDTNVIVQRALTNLKTRVEESQAQISYHNLPAVYGDPLQLLQLFQNLLSNAIKFHSDRPLHISVGATQCHEPIALHTSTPQIRHAWQFWIRDNGIGIDPEFQERIFEIFQRLHSRNEYPGSGIGLSICKKIVEQHGGKIWVESPLSNREPGTTFYLTLPAHPVCSESD